MGRNDITASSAQGEKGISIIRRLLPGLVVSLVCLAVVLYLIDPRQFIAAVQHANLWALLAGAGLGLAWLLVRGLVWRTLLQEKASYPHVFLTLNEGYLLNNILPLRLGEVGRAFLLGRKARLGFWQVVPTIFIERILDIVMAAGLFLSTLPFVVGITWAKEAAIVGGTVVLGGLAALYLMARNRGRVLTWLEKAGRRWAFLNRLLGTRAEAFFEGLGVLTHTRRFLLSVGWMALNWLVGVLQYYVLLLAFFPQARPLWAAFCLGAAALGIAAPSSPGALGVFEAVVVGALAAFGLNASSAAAFALVTHAISYLMTSAIGGYALAMDGETLAGLYRELGKMKEGNQPG